MRPPRACGIPIVSHAGLERAVIGVDRQDYGNPLRLRRALDAGVRVVVAHCASMGQDRDIDKGPNGPYVDSFELFSRLLDENATRCTCSATSPRCRRSTAPAPALATRARARATGTRGC